MGYPPPMSTADSSVAALVGTARLVMVAGVSLGNLALAALILGGAQVLVSSYGNPVLGSLTIIILAVIILRFRTITT